MKWLIPWSSLHNQAETRFDRIATPHYILHSHHASNAHQQTHSLVSSIMNPSCQMIHPITCIFQACPVEGVSGEPLPGPDAGQDHVQSSDWRPWRGHAGGALFYYKIKILIIFILINGYYLVIFTQVVSTTTPPPPTSTTPSRGAPALRGQKGAAPLWPPHH